MNRRLDEDSPALAMVKLSMATQDAAWSALNLAAVLNNIEDRYTTLGWFLYKIGVL